MRELQTLRIDDKINDTLLLMEHPEIVTVGPQPEMTASRHRLTPTFPVDGAEDPFGTPGSDSRYPIFKGFAR